MLTHTSKTLNANKGDEVLQPQDAGEEREREREYTTTLLKYLRVDKRVDTLSGTRKHVGN